MSWDDVYARTLNGLNKVFSRKMLGSVLLGGATTNVVDYAIELGADPVAQRLMIWSGLWVLFLVTFIFWTRLEEMSDDLVQDIGD